MPQERSVIEKVLGTLSVIDGADSIDLVFETLLEYSKTIGFNTLAVVPLVNPAIGEVDLMALGRSNLPDEFTEKWVDKNYIFHDPIPRYALKTKSAFEWSEAVNHASRFGKKIMDEARDFNIMDGLTVPVSFNSFPTGIISLGHSGINLSEDDIARLELICIHSYIRWIKLTSLEQNSTIPDLSPREVDVLYYAAAGKTSWEIAMIHGLSEHSVKAYLKTINKKLNATNRAHAVAIAIKSGQIIP